MTVKTSFAAAACDQAKQELEAADKLGDSKKLRENFLSRFSLAQENILTS